MLASSTVQVLKTNGEANTLVLLEALKCPQPNTNNGEDNAVFKSLIGTLIRCPGRGHCADPLMCKHGFFQVTVPPLIPLSSTAQKLKLKRSESAPDTTCVYSCKMQWKARRAEIELLANKAAESSDHAKRIPVMADVTLLRACRSSGATQPVVPLDAALWLTQLLIQKTNNAFPSFTPKLLAFLFGHLHHPHQLTLAQFSAYNLRDILNHLDMLTIARTTKLTHECGQKTGEKVEDEHADTSKDASLFPTGALCLVKSTFNRFLILSIPFLYMPP